MDMAFDPKPLPLEASDLKTELFYDELIDAVAKLEVFKAKLKDSKLDAGWFMPTLQRKEALASSLLEGTQATLDGVLENQVAPNEKDKNLTEVLNYIRATDFGYDYLKGNKITNEFIQELHQYLMQGKTRGSKTRIGDYRIKQNYIFRTNSKIPTYIPPPHEKVVGLMDNLVHYINEPDDNYRPLVRIAIIHAQFETIHPFDDGNGRVGRMLIPLYLYNQEQLETPSFFISEALERDKFKYYTLLNEIRSKGNWSEWVRFFLQAVTAQCEKYIDMVEQINILNQRDIERAGGVINSSKVNDVINLLYKYPAINAKTLMEHANLSSATAVRYLNALAECRILYADEKHRNRTYFYYDLLNIIRS